MFRVYANGKFIVGFSSVFTAMDEADRVNGTVYNRNGQEVYRGRA